jgi:hypothetical protein
MAVEAVGLNVYRKKSYGMDVVAATYMYVMTKECRELKMYQM